MQAPDPEKDHEDKPVLITHQQRDAHNDQGGCQRADDGNEFEHAAEGSQNQRVGNTHNAEDRGVHDQGQRGQRQLGADEVGQHLVEIVEHIFQKLPLRTGLDGGEKKVAERTAVSQEKDR